LRRVVGLMAMCVLVALAGCVPDARVKRDGAGAPLVDLRRAGVTILPFAYRSHLPFEHGLGVELAQTVRRTLARRLPPSAAFVEPGRIEGYLRSTSPRDVDLSHVASTLDVDVIVTGKIRLVHTRENPPPGAYAGVGIVDVSVFDARPARIVLRRRVKVRLESDDLAGEVSPRPTRDVRRELIERVAGRITELVLSERDSAEGLTEHRSEAAGGET